MYAPLGAVQLAFRLASLRHELPSARELAVGLLPRAVVSVCRSALFLAGYCTTAWATTCAGRAALGRDARGVFVLNGFLAGAWCLCEAKARRMELALYCLPRALGSAANILVDHGWLPEVPQAPVALFALAVAVLAWAKKHEEEHLFPLLRWLLAPLFVGG